MALNHELATFGQNIKEAEMALTAAETAKLKRLEAKRDEPTEPVTDKLLDEMEIRIADVMSVSALDDLNEFWSKRCARFRALANDNQTLINEIRRLKECDNS